eukprot:13090507-Ditylum_brightwellii.AAC.1
MHGEQQIEGVGIFDTYAPVVKFSTACLLLAMFIRLGWTSNQINFTAAFVNVAVDEEIYANMLQQYRQEGNVLKLCRSLYDKVICLIYVDDCLFFAPRQSD